MNKELKNELEKINCTNPHCNSMCNNYDYKIGDKYAYVWEYYNSKKHNVKKILITKSVINDIIDSCQKYDFFNSLRCYNISNALIWHWQNQSGRF